jgi:hypothetical protein
MYKEVTVLDREALKRGVTPPPLSHTEISAVDRLHDQIYPIPRQANQRKDCTMY